MKENIIVKRGIYNSYLDKNTLLLGRRKSGKTLVLKEWLKEKKDVVCVLIDLEKISLSPENFAVEYIGHVCFNFLHAKTSDFKGLQTIEGLVKVKDVLGSKAASNIVDLVANELQKIKPNQELLVKSAFDFADALAKDTGRKFVIGLDNFESILDLNNFSQVGDVSGLINARSSNVAYKISSSAVNLVSKMDFVKGFEVVFLRDFNKAEAAELLHSLIGNADAAEEILRYANGNPYLVYAVGLRYKETNDARKAFLTELLYKNGLVYNYCNDVLNYSMNRARGQTLLKAILKVLAGSKGLRLTELSRKIYRSAPVTKSMLERLIAVDLVAKKDNKFVISDDVLGRWINFTFNNVSFDDFPTDEELKEVKYDE